MRQANIKYNRTIRTSKISDYVKKVLNTTFWHNLKFYWHQKGFTLFNDYVYILK